MAAQLKAKALGGLRRLRIRLLAFLLIAPAILGLAVALAAGSILSRPARRDVGAPPASLRATTVHFESRSGATIGAWYGPPYAGAAVVILSHGVRGYRPQLLDRAQFVRNAGYGVLIYDAQAHGESTGDAITFGHLESEDAAAALHFVRKRHPTTRVGFIGPSLAGASALLGPAAAQLDALVLEAVYPTLESAAYNRIHQLVGDSIANLLTPLLLWQVEPRLGFDPYQLNPIERIADARIPLLIVAGSEDRHTTLAESEALFEAAREPKQLWIVEGAGHESFHRFAPAEYEDRVLAFFEEHL